MIAMKVSWPVSPAICQGDGGQGNYVRHHAKLSKYFGYWRVRVNDHQEE